jgi:hypothetical protein
MSLLRFSGLFVAVVVFTVIFFRLRRHSENRLDVAVLSIFGFFLLMVSLFPGLVSLPAEVLSLDHHERGRLLTLLILSSVALWFFLIYERGKSKYLSAGFDRLVRAMAVEKFIHSHHDQMLNKNSILIVIPAYNEGENLARILPTLPAMILDVPVLLLIVDDGSSDHTASLCRDLNVPCARNLINRGGGAALRVGFDIALHIKPKLIVTMDGDGQHRPEDMENIIYPILNNQADLVIGSRMLGKMERYSTLRYWGVILFGKMISMLLGQKITDPASGYRAFNSRVLKACELTQDQYHTAEMIIEVSKRGLKTIEQPITIKNRISGKSKKGTNCKYALYFLKTVLRTWMR